LSTGHESDAEYVDLVLAEPVELDELPGRLTESLPEGIAVVGVAALADRAPALQEAVTSVEWRVDVARRDLTDADASVLREAVDAALVAPTLDTTKHRKGRAVVEDVRPVIRRLTVCDEPSTVVEMELQTQPRGAKPGEVLAAIGDFTDVRTRRTHQWIERDGARHEPLDADTRPRVPEACVS
jgi:radical SAM-linked protein